MFQEGAVRISVADVELPGELDVPPEATGIVIFAHGSGSSRHSPRNAYVARELRQGGIGTLLFDLLTPEEDVDSAARFDIPLLSVRLAAVTQWLMTQPVAAGRALGFFGASTGSAAALTAAAQLGEIIHAVVSRGGRPDLAEPTLPRVACPVLLIVGGDDQTVLDLNRHAFLHLPGTKELAIVPNASHLFEEPGALEEVAHLARGWFWQYLK